MLSTTDKEKIKNKMNAYGLKYSGLAKKVKTTVAKLDKVLNHNVSMPALEERLIEWAMK